MKKTTKILSIIMSGAILFALLSGCQKNGEPQASGTPSAAPSQTPEGTQSATELSSDTLVLTVGTKPVYWNEFKYWLYSSIQYAGIDPNSEIDWTQTFEDKPLSEFVLSEAVEAVRIYKTVEIKCEELGITLSEEDKASIASLRESGIAQLGSEEEYLKYLEENQLNEELMEYLYSMSYLHNNIYSEMYGEDASKLSDEDTAAFGDENGYFRAKHILIRTVDDSGNPLSEDQLTTNREKLQGILDQIKAASDPVAKFDELMKSSSEDPGAESYPDGYQFDAGAINFDQNFLNEVTALEINGFSQDIIEMEGMGYTILMRLPLDPDISMISSDASGISLRVTAAASLFETLLQTWSEEGSIEYEDAFSTIKPENIFGVK